MKQQTSVFPLAFLGGLYTNFLSAGEGTYVYLTSAERIYVEYGETENA